MTTVFITIGIAAAAVLLLAAVVVTIIVCSAPDIDEGVDQDSGDLGIQRSALFTEDTTAVPADRGGRHRPENVQLVPPDYLIPVAYAARQSPHTTSPFGPDDVDLIDVDLVETDADRTFEAQPGCCEDCDEALAFAEITAQLDLVDEVQQ